MSRNTETLPDWERVLSAAARLQQILPEAVLVGGTAAAVHAQHRFSRDADHVLTDLKPRFDQILAQIESVAGWKTARVQRPVQILGRLDGIETGIRQLIRDDPLENATRDYLDFVALADRLGGERIAAALVPFDRLYPQDNGESPLQQLQIQLANPLPYDLEDTGLAEYKALLPQWQDWEAVKAVCAQVAVLIFDRVCETPAAGHPPDESADR